jgi:hypothetical protein
VSTRVEECEVVEDIPIVYGGIGLDNARRIAHGEPMDARDFVRPGLAGVVRGRTTRYRVEVDDAAAVTRGYCDGALQVLHDGTSVDVVRKVKSMLGWGRP